MKKLWIENIENFPAVTYSDNAPNEDFIDVTNDINKLRLYGIRAGMSKDELAKAITDISAIDISFNNIFVFTNQNANYSYAIYPFLRDSAKEKQINEIDYTSVIELTQHLQRKNTWDKGSLTKVEYFESYNKNTGVGTNKLLQVDVAYNYDAYGQTDYRITSRKWYLRDNATIGVETTSTKYYDYSEGVTEGIIRRDNNLNNLKVTVPGLIIQTAQVDLTTAQQMGVPLFMVYKNNFDTYVAIKDPTIQTSITNDTNFSWLNNNIGNGVTIRQYLLSQLV